MNVVERLGVRPVVNAHNTLTALGGSVMAPEVVDAMRAAAGSFVDMNDLLAAAARRIADLTGNEDALVTSGASSGLLVAALGAMTGHDTVALGRLLERGTGALERDEIIVHRAQRVPYDNVLALAGARIVEIGNAIQTFRWELEAAIGDRTAAVLYVAGDHLSEAALPLADVVEIADGRGVPVIVDAAAQLPPRENLWALTRAGAAAVAFSGGKEIRGPQASGFLLGKPDFLAACRMHAFPHQRFGRPAKIGKEEIAGLVAAVESYMERDLDADRTRIERVTDAWMEKLADLPGVRCVREPRGEAARPYPRLRLEWDTGRPAARIAVDLMHGDRPLAVQVAAPRAIWINAELVDELDEGWVSDRIAQALRHRSKEGRS